MPSAFSPLIPSLMLSLSKYMGKRVASSVNDKPWERAVTAQPKDVGQFSSTPKTGGISWADIKAAIGAGDNSAERQASEEAVQEIKRKNGGALPKYFSDFEARYNKLTARKTKN